MSLLIGKGDTIYVRDVELSNDPIVVKWQQSLATRTERYIPAQYRGSDGTNPDITGKIFIQVSKADQFRSKHDQSKDLYTVKVNHDFLFGQNKEQTKRFLVFHDQNNDIYQARFVQSAILAAGNEAAKVARSLGYDGGVDFVERLVTYFGDALKKF